MWNARESRITKGNGPRQTKTWIKFPSQQSQDKLRQDKTKDKTRQEKESYGKSRQTRGEIKARPHTRHRQRQPQEKRTQTKTKTTQDKRQTVKILYVDSGVVPILNSIFGTAGNQFCDGTPPVDKERGDLLSYLDATPTLTTRVRRKFLNVYVLLGRDRRENECGQVTDCHTNPELRRVSCLLQSSREPLKRRNGPETSWRRQAEHPLQSPPSLYVDLDGSAIARDTVFLHRMGEQTR